MDSKHHKKKLPKETHDTKRQSSIPTQVINNRLHEKTSEQTHVLHNISDTKMPTAVIQAPQTLVNSDFPKMATQVINGTPATEACHANDTKMPTVVMEENILKKTIATVPRNTDQAIVIGQLFGKYMIEGELGRGGMGVVYKATDTQLKRTVALKVIKQDHPTDLKRFMRESAAMAQLEHQNITKLYEFGTSPQPFFTMEYIEGVTLSHIIKEKKIKLLFFLDVMIKVCDALAHAHKHGILHRDIKPSNIMINHDGEPKVMDFGVAKIANDYEKSLSKTGDIMGTILYMAPEQLEGNATMQSDIYSVGATMYEALTYRSLYQGDTYHNLMMQILQNHPIPPRQLNPSISPYFEAVCLKCLAKKQQYRYDSFKQLVRELKNLKYHKPIIAKKYTAWDTLKNTASEHKTFCVSVFVAVAAFLISFGFVVNAWHGEKSEKEKTKVVLNKVMELLEYATKEHASLQKDEKFSVLFSQIFDDLEKYGEEKDWSFVKGYTTQNMGDREKSIAYYNEQIRNNPNSHKAYNNRGIAYFYLLKYDLALRDYNKAIELQPMDSSFYNNRGVLYFQKGEYLLALRDYEKSIELNPQYAEAYNGRGRVYRMLEKYDLAFRDYNKAIEIKPDLDDAYNGRGNYYCEKKKYNLALQDFQKAMDLNPNSSDAYANRSTLYCKQKKYDLAVADGNKSIELNPQSQWAYANRGDVYNALGKYELALFDFNKSVELRPYYLSFYDRARFFSKWGKYKLAIRDYNKAIELKPDFVDAYSYRGRVYIALNKHGLGLRDFRKTIELDPDFFDVYNNRGNYYLSIYKFDLALRDYHKAMQLKPESELAYNNRARLYLEQKKYDLALKDCNKALSRNPHSWSAYMIQAEIYYQMKKYNLALRYYNKTIEMKPSYSNYYIRGRFFHYLKKHDLALRDYDRAIELNTSFAPSYVNRAGIYLELKKYDSCLKDLNKALELDSEFYRAYLNRGHLYYKIGKYTLAITDFEKATESPTLRKKAHGSLAACYTALQNDEKAKYHLRKFQELEK
ncbi:tetratricopeptide repeat protein [Candidatus Uabimicrobium amorphum]|uniref:non-specific serine/threonine protein kinase n=1 Tax=Uabimicrobium amorphum TaxID=2596890 RepID=A0A5S9ILJ5_UABAM|nr:tetratricopeptide repeat protein [Candidatus Uabimicrobium amorphum]BBM84118.1 hypothetical protein UABAM_02474 [Candidatus Uabimicrobium amorphum]